MANPTSWAGGRREPVNLPTSDKDRGFGILFENNHTVIIILDPVSLAIVDVNPAAADFYGWTREAMRGMTVDQVSSHSAAELRMSLQAALASPCDSRLAVHRLADGSLRDVEIHRGPLAAAGRALVYAIVHDVTERRQAEEAQSRLAAILEVTLDLVSICDPDGRLLYLNPAGRQMLGVAPAGDITQFHARDFLSHPSPRPAFDGLTAAARDGVWKGETELRGLGGTLVSVSQIILAHRDPRGALLFLSTTCRDITERRRTEQELRLQSAALNAAASAIVITERDGTIAWVNPSFTTLTGYAAGEAIGRNPRELLKSGLHESTLYEDLWGTICAGRVWRGELTNRRKDGSLYSERQSITPVTNSTGVITHFVAIKSDLTEQKRLEAQFLQAQKMEVVGRLAGGIAHDFNNLLTVINATAELAGGGLCEADPLRQDFEEIRRAGERAAALTGQLLAFSRKQVRNPSVLDLGPLISSMVSMLQRLIGEDVELRVRTDGHNAAVHADRAQLEQVVMNLAVNARDAMPRGGVLAIDVRRTSLKGFPYVALSVQDSGTGMDEATRQRLFEPFFTTKEPGKGTGLGLSTVYGIVRQSGGTVAVETAPGEGTTFTICLPLIADAAASPPPDAARRARTPRGSETILVVEDETALRKLAGRILRSAGYTVIECASGAEALLAPDTHPQPIQMMLTDVVLPGLDGVELASRMTRRHPDMKVLFTSGYTDDALVHRGGLDGSARFIAKPYTKADLTARVRDVLDA